VCVHHCPPRLGHVFSFSLVPQQTVPPLSLELLTETRRMLHDEARHPGGHLDRVNVWRKTMTLGDVLEGIVDDPSTGLGISTSGLTDAHGHIHGLLAFTFSDSRSFATIINGGEVCRVSLSEEAYGDHRTMHTISTGRSWVGATACRALMASAERWQPPPATAPGSFLRRPHPLSLHALKAAMRLGRHSYRETMAS
jgi:hypothetical protein